MNREPYDASDVRGMYPLRVRGGRGDRGPQIGPHLFEGRSAPNSTKPAAFTAVAWSPPSPTFPAVELWCFRTSLAKYESNSGDEGDTTPRATGATWAPVERIVEGEDPTLWLDMVPDAQGFTPPPNAEPDSSATAEKLRTHAAERLWLRHGWGPPNPSEWTVQVMRPFPGTEDKPSHKISKGLYAVYQDTITQPLAWVWVPPNETGPYREIWLTYLPRQQGGMSIPGHLRFATQELYEHTTLRFEWIDATVHEHWDLADYANTIAQFKAAALGYQDSPALSESELEVHDFRVDEIPTPVGRSTPTT